MPRRPLRLAAWIARKACEIHVLLNGLSVAAIGQVLLSDLDLTIGRAYLGALAPTAVCVAAWSIVRSQRRGAAEREFAAWYVPGPGCELVYGNGSWNVEQRHET